MKMTEARRILGLGIDEDPSPNLESFREARERMAVMVREAPNEKLAARYQRDLDKFDCALEFVREALEEQGLKVKEEKACEVKIGKAVFVPENKVADISSLPPLPSAAVRDRDASNVQGISTRAACLLVFVFLLMGAGVFSYFKIKDEQKLDKHARMAYLERQGAKFIENRRWPEAFEVYEDMEKLDPLSEMVTKGRRSIEEGMAEEQSQFIGYLMGEAQAAVDEGRWEDAEKAAQEVLAKYPEETEIKKLLMTVAEAKVEQEKQAAFEIVRDKIELKKLEEALSEARDLVARYEGDSEASVLLAEVVAAKDKADADQKRAKMLLAQALAKDRGEYDEEVMGWLREAVSLAPDDKEMLSAFEKMAAYTRTVRVPEDFKTVQEALADARDRDRLVIGEGVWEGPFIVGKGVELQGVAGKTILQCGADVGCVITVGNGIEGVRLTGLTVRHLSLDPGEDRYSLVLLKGAKAEVSDCRFEKGSGHGLAVTEGGHAKVMRCVFLENGWNGIAAIGAGSLLEAENCIVKENYQNGIESWQGAAVILSKNRCEENSRNGIHIDNEAASASILDNELILNREYGIVMSRAGSGKVSKNTIQKNKLGGMVVRTESREVEVKENVIDANTGPGLVLEVGLDKSAYSSNKVANNREGNLVGDVDFSE